MALGDILRQSLVAATTNTPRSQVQRRERTADLLSGIEQAAARPDFDPATNPLMAQLQAVNPAVGAQTLSNYSELSEARQKAMFQDAFRVNQRLEAGDSAGALDIISRRVQAGGLLGADMADTQEIGDMIAAGDVEGAKSELQPFIEFGKQGGYLQQEEKTAALQTFDALTNMIADPNASEDVKKAARVQLGLDPRAGAFTGRERTAMTPGLTEAVAASEAAIEGEKAGARTQAQLIKEFELQPQVEAAVKFAVKAAEDEAKRIGGDKTNAKALTIYETGIKNLQDAMAGTDTGPFAGLMPAVTSNQQIADGSVALMLPLLKNMFREAGEGTFTEGDQKILTDLIPTRKDTPAARNAKLDAMDKIVRAKLAPEAEANQPPQSGAVGRFQVEVVD